MRRDALGVEHVAHEPAQRIVSLVPSETETVVRLGMLSRLVGRTDYCVEPVGEVEQVPSVGGTKDASVEHILQLQPDLVLANKEENTREMVTRLLDAGVRVHTSFPCTVPQAVDLVADICWFLGIEPATHHEVQRLQRELDQALENRSQRRPLRVFCPIWMDPLMTIHADTFLSDMLDLAGAANVFATRTRLYPLAADLGLRAPLPPERVGLRDVRYPRVTRDEVIAAAPDVIALPSEPHPFSQQDADEMAAWSFAKPPAIVFVDGRDLCWYSTRMGEGALRLQRVFGNL